MEKPSAAGKGSNANDSEMGSDSSDRVEQVGGELVQGCLGQFGRMLLASVRARRRGWIGGRDWETCVRFVRERRLRHGFTI